MVEIYDHRNGLYSFEESAESIEHIPDLGPETYWMTKYISGFYDSPAAAEAEARAVIGWLRSFEIA